MVYIALPTGHTTRCRRGSDRVEKRIKFPKKIMKKVLKFRDLYSRMTMKVPQSGFWWCEVVEAVENFVENTLKF